MLTKYYVDKKRGKTNINYTLGKSYYHFRNIKKYKFIINFIFDKETKGFLNFGL